MARGLQMKALIERLEEEYFDSKDPSVREYIKRFAMKGDKVHERSMPIMMSTDELVGFKEYDWSRSKNRSGEKEWDKLLSSMSKKGWDKRQPLHLTISKKRAWVGEGNHRLAIAQELGIKKIPVFVTYR